MAACTRGAHGAGSVADIGRSSTVIPRAAATSPASASQSRASRSRMAGSGSRISCTSSARPGTMLLAPGCTCTTPTFVTARPPPSAEPRAPHGVHEAAAVDGGHGGNRRRVEPAAEGARAEEASVATFLVAPRGHRERSRRSPRALVDRVQALEPGDHAERAVEDAALGHGVDVRAGEDHGRVGAHALQAQTAEDVAGS